MLTHQCNLKCVYCYEKNKDSKRVMTIDTMKEIITNSFDAYKDKYDEIVFDFMGGEPILEFENTIKGTVLLMVPILCCLLICWLWLLFYSRFLSILLVVASLHRL